MISTPDHDFSQYLDTLDLNTDLSQREVDWMQDELGGLLMAPPEQPTPFNAERAMRHLTTMTELERLPSILIRVLTSIVGFGAEIIERKTARKPPNGFSKVLRGL